MFRLVEADLAPAWQPDPGDRTPSLPLHIGARDAFVLERGHLCLEIVTHEIQFVPTIFLVGMERGLGRRQSKNQPSMAGIHRFESEDIPEECAICFRVFAVHDDMRTEDYELCPFLIATIFPQKQLSLQSGLT